MSFPGLLVSLLLGVMVLVLSLASLAGRRPHPDTVTVYMDGRPRLVPREVWSWGSLRAALGVRPGYGVAIRSTEGWAVLGEGERDLPGRVVRCWDFGEGDEHREIWAGRSAWASSDEDDDPADWWKR